MTAAPLPSPEDAELQRLLQRGSPDGLERLVLAHGGRIQRWLEHQFHGALDAAAIDDVMAHAMHRAWRARTQYDVGRGTARAWFGTIAFRCALVELSRARKFAALYSCLESERDRRTAGDGGDTRLLFDLHYCIDRLSPLQRAVVLADLADNGRAPAADLARQNETTTGTIYTARAKAICALRRMLAECGYGFVDRGPQVRPRPKAPLRTCLRSTGEA